VILLGGVHPTARAQKKAADEAAVAAVAVAGGAPGGPRRPTSAPASGRKEAETTKTSAGKAGWYEGRRGWSPASAATAPVWKQMVGAGSE
jgi:hypothetical protein